MQVLRLYFRHVAIHVRAAMEYRASFALMLVIQVLTPLSALAGVYFLFKNFGALQDWTLPQILLCFAVTYLSFALAECFGRGFDTFSRLIRQGSFDRLMVQPRNLILLTFCSDFALNRVSKIGLALCLLVYAALHAGIRWTAYKLLVLVLMALSGTLVFLGVWIAFAALCFVTIEGLEVVNIFTDGGRELSSYPLDIYLKPVCRFFTLVIPFGVMNYLPLRFLVGKAPAIYGLSPLYALPFLAACVGVFYLGVRHYRSAG